MAVIIDIGEADDIHRKNKPEVGRRLALQALAKSYGRPVLCSGPMYAGCTLGGGEIRIRFSHTDGGLKTVDGGVVKGFCIAGGDHRFHMAEARIEGDEVIVRLAGGGLSRGRALRLGEQPGLQPDKRHGTSGRPVPHGRLDGRQIAALRFRNWAENRYLCRTTGIGRR